MNIFKRLFNFFQSRANSMTDNLEDSVFIIEEKLEEMKADLSENIAHLGKIQALSIERNHEFKMDLNEIENFEKKAIDIIKKGQENEINKENTEKLAKEALFKKEEILAKIDATKDERDKLNQKVKSLQETVELIKTNISDWENELKILKAEIKVNQAEKNINQQMTELENMGTADKLEALKESILQYEMLSDSTIEAQDDELISLGNDIDFTLNEAETKASLALKKLKDQLEL
ncbi:PspA/IM30 family protein [Winogradskyella sp.]